MVRIVKILTVIKNSMFVQCGNIKIRTKIWDRAQRKAARRPKSDGGGS